MIKCASNKRGVDFGLQPSSHAVSGLPQLCVCGIRTERDVIRRGWDLWWRRLQYIQSLLIPVLVHQLVHLYLVDCRPSGHHQVAIVISSLVSHDVSVNAHSSGLKMNFGMIL